MEALPRRRSEEGRGGAARDRRHLRDLPRDRPRHPGPDPPVHLDGVLHGRRAMKDTYFLGKRGEYLVASELSRLRWLLTPTPGAFPGVDIHACRRGRPVRIQVKTSKNRGKWILTRKDETPRSDFFVFVYLPRRGPPEFSAVPTRTVARRIRRGRRRWLRGRKRNGERRRDSAIRTYRITGQALGWGSLR